MEDPATVKLQKILKIIIIVLGILIALALILIIITFLKKKEEKKQNIATNINHKQAMEIALNNPQLLFPDSCGNIEINYQENYISLHSNKCRKIRIIQFKSSTLKIHDLSY